MITPSFSDIVTTHAQNLLSGDIDEIIRNYQEIFPVFLEGRVRLIDGRGELRDAPLHICARLQSNAVTRVEGVLTEGEELESGRHRYAVEWHYFADEATAPDVSSVVYYSVKKCSETKVEMVEFRVLAFPNGTGWPKFDATLAVEREELLSRFMH